MIKPTSRKKRPSAGRQGHAGTRTSLVDVARKARVSLGTASRVVNGEANVNPKLRRQVLVAGRKLGFSPKMRRRHLAIITDYQGSILPVGYVSIMTSLITRFAVANRFAVELIDIANMESAYDCHIDGAIGVVFDDRILELQEIPNLPVVAINHPLAHNGINSIYTDHFEQAVLATEHLIERGHSRIAFLAMRPDEWGASERLRGFRNALDRAGIEFDPSFVRYTLNEEPYDILQRWVRNDITAILNLNDNFAMAVIHILSNVLGLCVGRDISTITLEDLPVYNYFTPPQTVIRQPLERLAELAVENIARTTEDAQDGKLSREIMDVCLHGELVARDSVADLRQR
jgi:LacI family transcriptional regulator